MLELNAAVIAVLCEQHRLLQATTEEVGAALGEAAAADWMVNRLGLFRDQIHSHLDQEDGLILAWLLSQDNEDLRTIGRWFQEHTREVRAGCATYFDTWVAAEVLEKDWDGFRSATGEIFRQLNERIELEETVFFPSFQEGLCCSPEFLNRLESAPGAAAMALRAKGTEPREHDLAVDAMMTPGGSPAPELSWNQTLDEEEDPFGAQFGELADGWTDFLEKE